MLADIDRAGRGLAEQARLEVEVVAVPIVGQHHELLAEGADIGESLLQAAGGLLLGELVGNGDDNWLSHLSGFLPNSAKT